MEDIATTYQILHRAGKVKCVDLSRYHHYRYRPDSLSHMLSEQNIVDYWLAYKEMYDYCVNYVDHEAMIWILKRCAIAIVRAKARRNDLLSYNSTEWDHMRKFARTKYPFPVLSHFPLTIMGGVILAKSGSQFSFRIANVLYHIMKKWKGILESGKATLSAGIHKYG